METDSSPVVGAVSPLSDYESIAVDNVKEVTAPAYSDEKILYEPEQTANGPEGRAEASARDVKDEKIVWNGEATSPGTADKPVDPNEKEAIAPPADRETLPEVVRDEHNAPEAVSPSSLGYVPSQPMTSGRPEEDRTTVTPLHLLADQPDLVDCPFCQRRAETVVKKVPSTLTHVWGGAFVLSLFLVPCAPLPYLRKWNYHIDHHCSNCGRKVAQKQSLKDTPEVFGTPDHLRVASKYPGAEPKPTRTEGINGS
ncbi:hypothetical protein GQ53DRAFT_869296 [Thozetella sp. PMI_491]|nr:hypothetical protein GQ53DRAFT_869296 [Thozetella sp. PMI_491]